MLVWYPPVQGPCPVTIFLLLSMSSVACCLTPDHASRLPYRIPLFCNILKALNSCWFVVSPFPSHRSHTALIPCSTTNELAGVPDRVKAKRVCEGDRLPTGSEFVFRNQASQSRRHFFVFPQLQAVIRLLPIAGVSLLHLASLAPCLLWHTTVFPSFSFAPLLAARRDKRVLESMHAPGATPLLGTLLSLPKTILFGS